MQVIRSKDQGAIQRLKHRADFAKQALPEGQVRVLQELELTDDAYEQEILWGQWTEAFFEKGKITWEAFAAVPLLQIISLKNSWFDLRPLWEYLLFVAHHVERIYFFYDRHPGPDFSAEDLRWKDVAGREESRPWLRLAFHAFREYVSILEERLDKSTNDEKELIYKLLWISLSFGKVRLAAHTKLKLKNWACEYHRHHNGIQHFPDQKQLGLFSGR
ncbi:MAG: hypothetical protein MRZ79_08790 [Bacteroidia bacterium]|nr:hypothetical protein [Bacteroidia bacterium]